MLYEKNLNKNIKNFIIFVKDNTIIIKSYMYTKVIN